MLNTTTHAVMTIYYIDDDIDDRDIFTGALEDLTDREIDLHVYSNPADFLSRFNYDLSYPAFVFVDLNMPGVSGYDVLVELRKKYTLEQLPVVLYSTSSDPISARISQKFGANAYLRKQNSHKELAACISDILDDKLLLTAAGFRKW